LKNFVQISEKPINEKNSLLRFILFKFFQNKQFGINLLLKNYTVTKVIIPKTLKHDNGKKFVI